MRAVLVADGAVRCDAGADGLPQLHVPHIDLERSRGDEGHIAPVCADRRLVSAVRGWRPVEEDARHRGRPRKTIADQYLADAANRTKKRDEPAVTADIHLEAVGRHSLSGAEDSVMDED